MHLHGPDLAALYESRANTTGCLSSMVLYARSPLFDWNWRARGQHLGRAALRLEPEFSDAAWRICATLKAAGEAAYMAASSALGRYPEVGERLITMEARGGVDRVSFRLKVSCERT